MANQFPTKVALDRLREQYPVGMRVELVSMDDPYSTLRPGDQGNIDFIDDSGTAHVRWDNGSRLGLVYGEDSFKRADDKPRNVTGASFWRDTIMSYGLEEARIICSNYLATQLRQEHPKDEHQFCRELCAAMYEGTAGMTDPTRLIYPYPFAKAYERLETSYYHASRERNGECARAIDDAINGSCYKLYYYNLDIAAMKVSHVFGFERVQAVLMYNIHKASDYDVRYSQPNREWAQGLNLPKEVFQYSYLKAHPILVEDFAKHIRKLYDELGAERFALPGRPESGEVIHGYEITRAIAFDDQRGFVIGHNPDAVSPYCCWQFTTENGNRDFYWGTYADDEKDAANNYVARIAVYMSGGEVREVPSPSPVGMRAGQNCDMPKEKTSVLKQIREAQKEAKPPRKRKASGKKKDDIEI